MSYCCFGNCNSDSRVGRPGYESGTKFYIFPKPCFTMRNSPLVGTWSKSYEKQHIRTCKKCSLCWDWMVKCKRNDNKFSSVLHVSVKTYICSKHFEDAPVVMDYEKYVPRNFIKPNPSRTRRQNLYRKRMASQQTQGCGEDIPEIEEPQMASEMDDDSPEYVSASNIIQEEECEIFIPNEFSDDVASTVQQETLDHLPKTRSVGVQTTWVLRDVISMGEEIITLKKKISELTQEISNLKRKVKVSSLETFESNVKQDDKMCRFYTGLDNNQFNALKYFCEDDEINYWGNETVGVEGEGVKTSSRKRVGRRKLTRNQEFLLFFLRTRGGFLIQDIAYRFGLAPASISRIVSTLIQYMYDKFSSIRSLMFPSRDVIKEHLPHRFAKFKNIRVIFDCAEIFCEKPSNFEQQGNSYSEYKAHSTFKVLIGVTPNGTVSFVSDLFEGSISDRQIVEKSGVVEMLEEGDLVLVDRGFTIQDLTDEKKVVLKIPAFLKQRDCLTAQEEIETKVIAANRIFVEHVVGRLKNFRLFRRVVPQAMRHVLSQCVFVCACLLNFMDPIVPPGS